MRVVLVALLALPAAWAQAQSGPWYLGVAQSLAYESNVLRLADDTSAPGGFSRGDTVSGTSLLAGFDQRFGRQRAFANLSLRSNRYAANATFNNFSYSGSAGLDWSTVERLSGSLSASTSRNLASFNGEELGLLTQKNLESVNAVNARLSLGLVTAWSFELQRGRRELRNSLQQDNVQAREFSQDTSSLGLRWRPGGAVSVGLNARRAQGRYPKFRIGPEGFQPDRFRQSGAELAVDWQPSGASVLDLRLSHVKTRYDLNEQRDFSGLTGSLGWNWRATGKLRIGSRLSRDTGQDSYATTVFGLAGTADYSRVNTTARVQVDYDATAKIALVGVLQVGQRSVVRTVANPVLPLDASGRDRSTVLALGGRWAPRRSVLAGCDLSHEVRRASGELTSNLRGDGVSCFAQLVLQ